MGWNNIRIDPADRDFSLYIRLKAKKCTKCGKMGEPDRLGRDVVGLQASHFHGRGKWTTRFDEENVDVLCVSCHRNFTDHKNEYKEWKKEQMGEKAYDLLELRANTTGKKDFLLQRIIWKQALKELDAL